MSNDQQQVAGAQAPAASPETLAALTPPQLYRKASLDALPFKTTDELAPVETAVGQQRALDAIGFGSEIDRDGFNIFVIGSSRARMQETVKTILSRFAEHRKRPGDWVYINNFKEAHKPIAIELPAGRAAEFRDVMRRLIADLKVALPAMFESEDYQSRRNAIDQTFQTRQGDAFTALRDKANAQGITILRTPLGLTLAPAENGKIVPPEEFSTWPAEKQKQVQEVIRALEQDLESILKQVPQWEKLRRDEIEKLNRETAQFAVGQSIEEAKEPFADLPRVLQHLEAVRADLVDNVAMFVIKGEGAEGSQTESDARLGNPFDRYAVNVLVQTTSDEATGGPVVEELHPTLARLIGSIEYVSRQGTLVTNFRLIKAGAMHRANGGFLLLDLRTLLMEPFSWAALKRMIRQREVRIEDVGRFIGLTSTVSLEPDPIPLDLKVVLFGDRLLYYLLAAFDPEVSEHFKVLADFEDDIDRSAESEAAHARLIAAIARKDGLRPLDRDAVALVIEYAARLADHAGKLSLSLGELRDLLAEAGFWAEKSGHAVTVREAVDRAITQREYRASRLRERAQESILRDFALIDTAGVAVGQVNGLSVTELGGFRFGRPTRITCRVRPGTGKLVDIEREVEMGGPIHSKGVLILSGFLAGRFALDTPMSLFASLVFEQSYGGVEGDSASSAELYALLSALSELPLRQDLAVTGSVNQHGQIQAIGGANEKIEGFFDICKARGLAGSQGVLIPQSNVQNLMLRREVIEACEAGKFAVYPVSTIDQGIALLTGRPSGERTADGLFPVGSVNRLVEDRLRAFARIRQSFAAAGLPDVAKGRAE
ncbi:MAG: Lon protease family protein [Pseudorhodoplanes sp.]|nr:Lon protease family protein [Pseudorhodoplanes sp.]GIK81010.1 MAG: ATP-dependent protease [Alphaproteobacteria bacterium]